MVEDDESRRPADPAALFARQLREATERLMGGWPGLPGVPGSGSSVGGQGEAPPRFPLPPATLSAQHLQSVVDDIAARRAQVQALRTHLGAFDEQLGVLETNLRPLLEWLRAWADIEGGMTGQWGLPGERRDPG